MTKQDQSSLGDKNTSRTSGFALKTSSTSQTAASPSLRFALLFLCAALAGCLPPNYVILRGSGLQNPPSQKLTLRITPLEDPTGLYPKLKVKFEDELVRVLSGESVKAITNLGQTNYTNYSPRIGNVKNIYSPVYDSNSSTGSTIGQDLLVTGSVQEIYFGDAGFNAPAYATLGLVGVAATAGTKAARVSILIKVIPPKENKTIFSKRIEMTHQGKDLDRTIELDVVMREVVFNAVSYLLQMYP